MEDDHSRNCETSASSWGTEITLRTNMLHNLRRPNAQLKTHFAHSENIKYQIKCKSVSPVTGLECPRMFPDFVTTVQDSGKFVNLTQRPPLPPGNTPGTHFC